MLFILTKVNTRDPIGSKNRKMLQYMKEGITGTRESLYPPDVLCECCYKIVDKAVIIVPLHCPLVHCSTGTGPATNLRLAFLGAKTFIEDSSK